MDVWVPSRSRRFSSQPLDCSQSRIFRKIVKIEHFALQAAILVSNVMSLAWRWVSNRGLWTVYTALYAPPCMKEREQAPITLIKQWKDIGKKRRDIIQKEHKLSRKKKLMPMKCSTKSLNTTTQTGPRAVYSPRQKQLGHFHQTPIFFPSHLSPLPPNIVYRS